MNTNNKSYYSSSLPNTTIYNTIDDINNNDNLCEICYESNKTFQLNCCNNTKKICDFCLECLTTPICPWCRKKLPDNLIKDNMVSQSLPDDYISYFNNERQYLLIDPDDPEYADSRILRIALRNIRRNYYRSRSSNSTNSRSNQSRILNRQRRHNIRNSLNRITRDYNEGRIELNQNLSNDNFDDPIFPIDL